MLDIEDPAALCAYLRETGRIGPHETPRIEVLAGGVSNRTVLVTRADGTAWVLKQALEKLRVRVDWFSSPARIRREALGMRYLATLAPPATTTQLIFEDEGYYLLAMEAVPQPHRNWKTLLLDGQLAVEAVAAFAQILASIHQRAYLERATLEPLFRERAFFESLRVEPYYAYTATHQPGAAGFYAALIADTRARLLTLVHGDYSPKNILVRGEKDASAVLRFADHLVLLDHEVIHWGDPAFDLGFSMTHLLSKAHHVVRLRAEFAAATRHYWETYRAALGDVAWAETLEPFAVRQTLGCLLARVDGRSPLEYLSEAERARQRGAVLALMMQPPPTVSELVEGFVARIG